ncbi:hypothetical protein BC826DRAFT_1108983 [Russula brevipes]|nr:hypothetical protein BC826DRAFT_1108983 [Russula brevipes]
MSHSSVVMPTTLSRLRWFMFGGASTYLEALLPSMTTPLLEKNLRFGSAKFDFFENGVSLNVHPHEGAKQYALGIPVLSSVVDLTLDDRTQSPRLTEHAQWRIILGTFNGVKTLHVGSALVFPVSRSLRLDEGEPTPTPELLPELQELSYYSTSDASDPFAAFINARQNSGRPVNLIRR